MFDTEKFIAEVEKRPAIYNLTLKDYSNRDVKARLWSEIGMEMYEHWNEVTSEERNNLGKELQTRWKSIRDQFKKDISLENKVKSGQATTKKRKYIYYDQLHFLKIFLINRSTLCNLAENQKETEIQQIQHAETEDASIPKTSNVLETDKTVTKKKLLKRRLEERSEISDITTKLSESVALRKQEIAEDTLGNRAFLMSLLPLMNNMPQNSIIYLRLKMMELFNTHCLSHPLQSNSHQPIYNLQESHDYEIPFYTQQPASSSTQFGAAPMPSPLQYSDTPSPTTSAESPCDSSNLLPYVKQEDQLDL